MQYWTEATLRNYFNEEPLEVGKFLPENNSHFHKIYLKELYTNNPESIF